MLYVFYALAFNNSRSFSFVDNKLVSGSYTMTMSFEGQTMSMPVEFTVTYGGVTITLPTNVVVE